MILGEAMDGSHPNMPETVVIPTAGTGSRMGNLVDRMHKCMLPYLGKPIIAHIIDAFPRDTRFIIPVGHYNWHVKSLIRAMYRDRSVEFVEIANYKGLGAGTAHTLLECQAGINSAFWYVACDTYFNDVLPIGQLSKDTYFTKSVPTHRSDLYTMFRKSGNELEISFKQAQNEDWTAFTGLMYIADHQGFFDRLIKTTSTEFIDSLAANGELHPLESWIDMGNRDDYLAAVRKSEPYDFTKKDEMIWMVNGKVLKWAAIWEHMKQRKIRAEKIGDAVVPENVEFVDQMLVYDMIDGNTAYHSMSPDLLPRVLTWLKTDVWKPVPTGNFRDSCMEFYRTKSRDRILGFVNEHRPVLHAKSVNGVAVGNWSNYLSSINWEYLATENRPAWIHGDLQFDNVIVKPNGELRAIDWRPCFGQERFAGDIYYDLAKLLGGCIIDYSKIKKNEFSVTNDGKGNYELTIPSVDIENARGTILAFTSDMGMDTKKVEQLVPLIFWNMAPLHAPPFNDLLWCLGLKLFSELSNA